MLYICIYIINAYIWEPFSHPLTCKPLTCTWHRGDSYLINIPTKTWTRLWEKLVCAGICSCFKKSALRCWAGGPQERCMFPFTSPGTSCWVQWNTFCLKFSGHEAVCMRPWTCSQPWWCNIVSVTTMHIMTLYNGTSFLFRITRKQYCVFSVHIS